MKQLLNTLYVLTPHSALYERNNGICVSIGGEEKVSIPANTIDSIVCFGIMNISTPLIKFCGEHNIQITFLSEYGRFWGKVVGPTKGNVLLRTKQYKVYEDENTSIEIAKNIIGGKLKNSRNFMTRQGREDPENKDSLSVAATMLKQQSIALKTVTNRDSIRGIEGTAASIYFQQFDKMLHSDKIGFSFETRSRRPPQNEVNATLSFAYAMLTNEYTSAIESIGLDPAVGVLHSVRPGRPSLALDLMEELRAPLCDRLTIAMFNRRELQSSHFDERSDGVSLNEKGRKLFLQKWQLRKNEEIIHPYLQEKMKIGLIPFIQAQLFAKTIRGELPEYPPFIWR